MLILRNFLMNGVCFAVPGGGTGNAAPAGDQQQQDQNTNDAGGDQGNAGDANDNDAGGDQGAEDIVESEGGETDSGDDAAAAGDPPADKTDWRDKEIGRKHAQLQQNKARTAELERENEELRALAARAVKKPGETDGGTGDGATERQPTQNGGLSQDDVERAAARQIAARDFNNAANDADQKGRKTYAKDWDKVTSTLKTLGGFEPEDMQGILATDDPAKVLHTLGSKPDEYHRIMDLPPAKRLAEMVKMALPAPKPKNKPSQAAAPVQPVQGRTRTGGTELRDDLSDDDWYARRRAQKDANWKAKSGRA